MQQRFIYFRPFHFSFSCLDERVCGSLPLSLPHSCSPRQLNVNIRWKLFIQYVANIITINRTWKFYITSCQVLTLGVWRRSSSWGLGPAHAPCLGGLLSLVPGGALSYVLCLLGLCPGASSAVFWVDAWLSLRWASRVLCSVRAAGGLGLGALSACF